MCDMKAEDLVAIHDYYLSRKNPIHGLVDFLSEIYFIRDTVKTVKMMRMHCDEVFHYLYAFCGQFNKVPQTPLYSYDGAGHADEDAYLFKNEADDVHVNAPDLLNRERMVQMWTNFIKIGLVFLSFYIFVLFIVFIY